MKKIVLSFFALGLLFTAAFAQSLQNVVVEEHTGAWCGYCPEGAEILEDLVDNNPNVIPVSIHDGDQMYVPLGGSIANFYNPAYPQATINRNSGPISRGSWASAVNTAMNQAPSVYVSFDSVIFEAHTRKLTVRLKADFVQNMSGQFRFNVYMVENEMSGTGTGWDQVSYFNNDPNSTFYQMGNPIPNYIHKYVFRDAFSYAWGQAGSVPGNAIAGESYYHTFTKVIPAYYDEYDMKLVGMLNLHGGQGVNSRPTLNAASMDLGTAVGIEDGINANSNLLDLYPNPASDRVSINYTVQEMGMVTLEVRNQLGQLVRTLGHDMKNAGAHSFVWDGRGNDGLQVADGLYMVRMLTENGQSLTKRIIINH